jgi:hypothetical protein
MIEPGNDVGLRSQGDETGRARCGAQAGIEGPGCSLKNDRIERLADIFNDVVDMFYPDGYPD